MFTPQQLLLLAALLVGTGAAPAVATDFNHRGFAHSQFRHTDLRENSVSRFRANEIRKSDGFFGDGGKVNAPDNTHVRFQNTLSSVDMSEGSDERRWSEETQKRLRHMRMQFEDDSRKHLNFN